MSSKPETQTTRVRTADIKALKLLAAQNEITMMDTLTVLLRQFKAEHGTVLDHAIVEKVLAK